MKKSAAQWIRAITWAVALFLPSALAHTSNGITIQQKPSIQSQAKINNADAEQFNSDMEKFLESLSPKQQSALQKRLEAEKQVEKSHYGISFYEPTYILPFYYTSRPYQSIYQGTTPNNQKVDNDEFKGQLSLLVPIWLNMFDSNFSINVSYTQLSFWQIYAKSQYFRETDYEPAIFLNYHFLPNWLAAAGLDHESNGRGGTLERSWNRVFFDLSVSGENWLVDIKPWFLVLQKNSSIPHNPDITKYLGYERVVIAYKFYQQEISLMFRNTVESKFKYGALEFDYAFPIHGLLRGYIQLFSGYGQSLIEYDHYTNGVGIGLTISNWI